LLPLVLLVLGLLVRNVLLIQVALLRLWRFVAHDCLRSMAKAIARSMILLVPDRKLPRILGILVGPADVAVHICKVTVQRQLIKDN
jgi:hypothetical protein